VSERGSESGDGWLVLKAYLGVWGVGAVVGAVAAVVLASRTVAVLEWAFGGAMVAGTLIGFPLVYAAVSGLFPKPDGRQLILTLYAVVVGVAGFTGLVIASIGPADLRPPKYLGLIPFPTTPVGMGLYGALTLATVLGVVLALVTVVSWKYVDEPPRSVDEK
jgi:hypothetical protein